ncbi:MAG: peptidoglycan DD-metalloendopeptidase family protein [Patescibacteria group bacterium]
MALRLFFSVVLASFSVIALALPPAALADETADAIQQNIDSLKNEIDQLTIQLNNTISQKNTLQSAVAALDLQIKKLTTSISLTNAQISQKDSQIKKLSGNIFDTQGNINSSQGGVAETLRQLALQDDMPVMEAFLGKETLSGFFDEATSLGALRDGLQNQIEQLSSLKSNLVSTKDTATQKRKELATLQANLASQKQGLAAARTSQSALLAQTKNQESSYQALIADKKAQEQRFENDLLNYEAGLGLSVAAGSLPPVRPGTLAWPLDSIHITQYFGNTDFATKNPQIYSGHGHTGVDFGASPGTRVLAAAGGVVLGTGNTDTTCPNASFGKWVFVKHPNGLSTLYAHLSVISVSQGQSVSQGSVVGYSGSTGYATGPHLHFGVYASSGSEIASFPSSSCKGKIYTMPVGDVSAYLNPLSYLPAL